MPLPYQIIFCSCPDNETATHIAQKLVSEKLAACVNILPSMTSIYRWQDEIETAQEHLLLIKSHADYYPKIQQAIIALHPYELPEIVAVPMERALPDYLQWINSCVLPK